MIVNEELYKRMILYIAEINNCYDESIYENFGITWMQLHRLRMEIEATGLTYDMLAGEEE